LWAVGGRAATTTGHRTGRVQLRLNVVFFLFFFFLPFTLDVISSFSLALPRRPF
jgi:hypothetical protein